MVHALLLRRDVSDNEIFPEVREGRSGFAAPALRLAECRHAATGQYPAAHTACTL